ncbi:hypothetical protein EDB83DRAFT_2322653 [Lactarius deliciosus]|nr:hypothetical protein EDB83DRAFT_2322653 [Lactarius deliciosus]
MPKEKEIRACCQACRSSSPPHGNTRASRRALAQQGPRRPDKRVTKSKMDESTLRSALIRKTLWIHIPRRLHPLGAAVVLMFLTSEISRAESPSTSPDVKRLVSGSPQFPPTFRRASPLLFGPLFNWTLYGVLCVQLYVYSYNFPKDRRPVKFLAYFVFLLETAQTALTGADAYYWFVDGFGNVHLGNSHFAPVDNPIITAVISLVVQGYFCHRIWMLSRRSSWICCVIAVSMVTQSVGAVWSGIKVGSTHILYSTEMAYLTAFRRSWLEIMVDIECPGGHPDRGGDDAAAGTLVLTLVLYVAFPNEVYYAYTSEIIGKLYSNTLLVSLNNRIYFRDRRSSERGDNASILDSDQLRATAVTSLHFAGTQSRAPTVDSFQPSTSIQTVELNTRKGDDTSINWSPLLSDSNVSERFGSPSSPTLGNVIYFLVTPSVRSTRCPPSMVKGTRSMGYSERWVAMAMRLGSVATLDATFVRLHGQRRLARVGPCVSLNMRIFALGMVHVSCRSL